MNDLLIGIRRIPAAFAAACIGLVPLTPLLVASCGGLDIPAVRFSQI